ncbi:MAG: hypothetical protein IPJ31_13180 [Bacteroidetes bacterium]|nr:hypothetical protein [Bacteroidota bacterium]
MKFIIVILTFLVSSLFLDTFSQKKIKTSYEYEILTNPKNVKESKKELLRIMRYDETGFLIEIITYGKKSLVVDSVRTKNADGSEVLRVIAKYPADMEEVGRVETFSKHNDQHITGVGYEFWNSSDTFQFENNYVPFSPDVYEVRSKTNIPESPKKFFCDHLFNILYDEAESIREYNDYGQITSKHYIADAVIGMVKQGMTRYLTYDNMGLLIRDSLTKNGAPLSINRYTYDHVNRPILQERTIYLNGENLVTRFTFMYNTNGDLIKKESKNWTLQYKFDYY